MSDQATWELLVLVLVLIANRLLVKAMKPAPLFWGFQAGLAALVCWFAWPGVAALSGDGVWRWIIPVLLVFHIVQNVAVRQGGKKL